MNDVCSPSVGRMLNRLMDLTSLDVKASVVWHSATLLSLNPTTPPSHTINTHTHTYLYHLLTTSIRTERERGFECSDTSSIRQKQMKSGEKTVIVTFDLSHSGGISSRLTSCMFSCDSPSALNLAEEHSVLFPPRIPLRFPLVLRLRLIATR